MALGWPWDTGPTSNNGKVLMPGAVDLPTTSVFLTVFLSHVPVMSDIPDNHRASAVLALGNDAFKPRAYPRG